MSEYANMLMTDWQVILPIYIDSERGEEGEQKEGV